ncbi:MULTISPECIES: type II toxin-antitoxin system RelE/ParE family toxin [unclassified Rhizobium]|jgi:plasmid stabilization system protein ParE|uniref:type II toxin-antitoxin system RelE/ParE family toxin n=1 Tax=unclassified Rhizobium TaxID=2613769 RepID=UPI00037F54CE|nr:MULTISPECIES: type II toxin-antitoxin system RelE/ParE family toxin [unclassified Rhizobium]MBB3447297.1 plasmid stabilization system protein ParE [Rhizobium sp. BK379]MBB3565873.1 plasmid stabilization system protein ParE [Rhizobium sp. BK512]
MILEFSNEAESDLEQIADYIAERNPQRALSFIRALRRRCEDLVDTPNGFALVPSYEKYGIRRRVHRNYLIFYRVKNAKVVIIHILHGATDYGAALIGE